MAKRTLDNPRYLEKGDVILPPAASEPCRIKVVTGTDDGDIDVSEPADSYEVCQVLNGLYLLKATTDLYGTEFVARIEGDEPLRIERPPSPIVIAPDGRTDRPAWEDATDEQRRRIRDLFNDMIHREHIETRDGCVEGVIERVKSEGLDYDAMVDVVHEACDGCLVYYSDAREYLMASDNRDAADEEGVAGESNECSRAYFALRADVLEELNSRGFGYDGEGFERAKAEKVAGTLTREQCQKVLHTVDADLEDPEASIEHLRAAVVENIVDGALDVDDVETWDWDPAKDMG